MSSEADIPLYLRKHNQNYAIDDSVGKMIAKKRPRSDSYSSVDNNHEDNSNNSQKLNTKEKRKKHKNAPAEMSSKKAVKRLRDNINIVAPTFKDPRFQDLNGKLNHEKFFQSYRFLEEYQEKEVDDLSNALKKTKELEKKEEIRQALIKTKQEMTERRRGQQLSNKLKELRKEESQKVRAGKTPYFLKKSKVKEIAMEERYNELKSEGKLHKFLQKKRKQNSNKDHRLLPARREGE